MVWMEAARLTAVERMPAVSQVSTGPVGGLGKMQAKQAVGRKGLGTRAEGLGRLLVVSSLFTVADGVGTQVPKAGPGAPDSLAGLGRMFMVAA